MCPTLSPTSLSTILPQTGSSRRLGVFSSAEMLKRALLVVSLLLLGAKTKTERTERKFLSRQS